MQLFPVHVTVFFLKKDTFRLSLSLLFNQHGNICFQEKISIHRSWGCNPFPPFFNRIGEFPDWQTPDPKMKYPY
jgi:hypothetical protein